MKKVSVIITTYKRPDYLWQAIESVLKQTFKDFELIIVNDDPESQSLEKIISSYKDPRIIYIKNEKNLGGAKSLNLGLRVASGDYIAILDDDDVWLSEDKMEKQVKFLDENPDYIIVGTSSIEVDHESETEVWRYTGEFGTENVEKYLLLKVPFAHSSVLYRKDIILKVGGYSEDLLREKDIDLYLKIAKLGKFGFLPDCFIKHREIFWNESNAKEFIKKRLRGLTFHRKVIWRHRKEFPHFWSSYLEVNFRYWAFKVFSFFPFSYKAYKLLFRKNN